MFKFDNLDVKNKFDSYPFEIKVKMLKLRSLILNTYNQSNEAESIEECLKWGEPSYLVKSGSTVRIDWKSKNSEFLNIYFNCKSKLVETYREIYSDELIFEKNRAILLKVNEVFPEKNLVHCFELAMNYHKIKHLPLLGV